MNHKWESNTCVRCGVVRDEIISENHGGHDVKLYQYWDRLGQKLGTKRPDCLSSLDQEINGSSNQTINGSSVSIKKIIKEPSRTRSFLIEDIVKNENNESKNFKQDYSELLKSPKWQRKRLEVFDRDNFTCVYCGDDDSTLHVHHKQYEQGKKPWEYPLTNFITLCEHCHYEIEYLKKNEYSLDDLVSIEKCKFGDDGYYIMVDIFKDESRLAFYKSLGDLTFAPLLRNKAMKFLANSFLKAICNE